MTSLLEFSARAALCRQLARREPDSKNLWLAEAERWSRLTRAPCAAVVTNDAEAAGTWHWKIMRKRKPRGREMAEVRYEFRNPAGRGAFEALLSDISAETGKPN